MRHKPGLLRCCLVILAFVLVPFPAGADDLLHSSHTEEWLETFESTVETDVAQAGILGSARDLVLELVADSPLPEDPVEAARYVVFFAQRADASLRQGVPTPVVRLQLTYEIELAAAQGFLPAFERAAPRRLRGQFRGGGLGGPSTPWGTGDTEEQRRWKGNGG